MSHSGSSSPTQPLLDFTDKNLVLGNILGASSIPLTVLVDERGKVVAIGVRGATEVGLTRSPSALCRGSC